METEAGQSCRIELLGGLRVRHGARTAERFPTKVGLLLAYLACYPHRLHSRETLMELCWPEREPKAARHNLCQTLTVLRRRLANIGVSADDVLLADRLHVRLRPGAFDTDIAALREAAHAVERVACAAERAEPLARLLALYQGDLLPGYYDDWIETERAELIGTYVNALRQAAEDAEQTGDLSEAISLALRILQTDRLDESAHIRLIRLHVAAGNRTAAHRQVEAMKRILKEEWDAEPSPETESLVRRLLSGESIPSVAPAPAGTPAKTWPTPGGALPLDSPLYVVRETDGEFLAALTRRESIVLVKGAQQIGKTSLLARGLQSARRQGTRVVQTDLQGFHSDSLASLKAFYVALADHLAGRLNLPTSLRATWDAQSSPNANFETYLTEEVLGRIAAPLVWGLDGVDRLFPCYFGTEVFALFRSWHNERALEPDGPWTNLTLAMAYATEAHLFIKDLHRSPFNVGTRLELEDFSREQVMRLNQAYDSPLRTEAEVTRFYDLIGGHPYLTQRGLHTLVTRKPAVETFAQMAPLDEGPLGDHLHRLLALLRQNPPLMETLRPVLNGRPCTDSEGFYRLRSAGILAGATLKQCRVRCALYAIYLKRQLSA